jgi:hypothetical protein
MFIRVGPHPVSSSIPHFHKSLFHPNIDFSDFVFAIPFQILYLTSLSHGFLLRIVFATGIGQRINDVL